MVCAFVVQACSPPPPRDLTILHTNDLHGKFRDTPATWRPDNPPIGGFANLSAYVNEEREKGGRVLLLDGGDLMTGNPICNYDYEGVQGGAMIHFMNLMGYDAMALGNHEFDLGLDNLYGLLSLAEFPVLSANTYRPEGPLTAPKRYVILKVDGLRVGVIGLITENLYGVASPAALAGTRVTSAVDAATEIVALIDDKTDLIVLLTHIGVEGDRELARRVDGIDLIVGGHSHSRLTEPIVENGIVIVQAGAHNRNLGRLHVTVQGDSVQDFKSELLELWPKEGSHATIAAEVAQYSERIATEFGQVIGRLATAWTRTRGESNVGNWIADQYREHTGADFALMNSGGIRKNINAGPITRLDIVELLPFNNALVTFECSGKELRLLLKTNAEAAVRGGRGALHVSGLRYSYAEEGGGVEIVDAFIGGKPIQLDKTYKGASNDFVVYGNAMRYLGFEPATRQIQPVVDSDVIMQAVINARQAIDARVEGRIIELGSEPAATQ